MIENILRYSQIGAILVFVVLFVIGFRIGARTQQIARASLGVAGAALLALLILLIGALTQRERIGPIVVHLALLAGFSVVILLVGSLFAGYALQQKSRGTANALVAVVCVLSGVLHTAIFARLDKIGQLAHDIGLDKPTVAPAQSAETCGDSLKHLYDALSQYAQDWDALPPAPNWSDNEELATVKRHPEWLHCPTSAGAFAWAYNDTLAGKKLNLAGKPLAQIKDAATTALLADAGQPGLNAHEPLTLPVKPGRRVLFLDGHLEGDAAK